ncbi:phage tail tape measure protein, TP901 family, core region [Parapedobacter composti]|uniref:Phage tail tape measure protein, TP901 family, core region n=1 Tax=Parapedobacter composti TaxID=623281 RepID=A0A1I1GDP1_9SPHI|nr:phage tail tape measure protein [Parapedobacter composti]SFC07453.1 phage tail tape measure protein, TP901 family, core region [Parapedobacter composti]
MARLEVGIGATNKELKSVLADSQTLVRNFSNNLQKINLNIGVNDRISKRIGDTRQSLRSLASTAKEVRGIKIDLTLGNAINDLKSLNTQLAQTKKLYGDIRTVIQSINSTGRATVGGAGSKQALEAEKLALAQARTEAQRYKNEIARVNTELANLRLANAQARQSTTAAAGSYREAQQRLTALGRAIREQAGGFNANNAAVKAQIAEYRKLNGQLKEFDALMGNRQRNVGNYPLGGLGGQLKGLIGTYASLYAVMRGAGAVISTNVKISDSIADVQRTAELSKDEVKGLVTELKSIPTRTGLNELLSIATIGGQLGIAKDELGGFVQALDFLGVALANEIPGGAAVVAESLGKINGVFRVAETQGLTAGQAMQKTGSAILALGQAGLATGQFLVDFTQRVGGAARTTGIALPTILAYGAVLEEAGVSAEVAGTAISKLIGQLVAKRQDFHAIAQIADSTLTLKQFTGLINTDADAALRKFFAGLAAGGKTTTQFYDILNSAGIKTERYRNAVLLLSQDQEKLTKLTALSTKEYNTGEKAAEQFAIRNLNLAGVLQQLGRRFTEAFVNSEAQGAIAQWLGQMTGLIREGDVLISKLGEVRASFSEQSAEINKLIDRYGDLIIKKNRTHKESEELKSVVNQVAQILPSAVTEWDKYGNALSISIDRVHNLSRAHQQLVKDMNISTAKQLNEDFNEVIKRAERYQRAINKMAESNKKGFTDWRTGTKGTLDNFRQWLAETNSEALKIAQNLQSIGAELTQEQRNLLAYYGLDEAGEAMRKYDASVKNTTASVKGLGEALQGVNGDGSNTTGKGGVKASEKAILTLEKLTQLRENAHLETLTGWEKELQASKYRWDKELNDAKDSIEQQIELRKYQAAETARILKDVGMETSSGRVVLKSEPAALKGLTRQLNLGLGEVVPQDWSRQIAEKFKEVNAPNLDWSEFSNGLKRVTNQFTRNMMGAIEQIGGMTEKKGKDVIGLLGNTIIDSFSGITMNVVSNKLQKHLDESFDNLGKGLSENTGKWLQIGILGAGLVGQGVSGVSSRTNSGTQAVGGLLKGAAAGASFGSVVPVIGTAVGAAVGAVIGGIAGWLGGESAKKQEKLTEQQLEEQRKQTALMERRNALSYTSQIIGQQTNQGLVTGVDRDEFGNIRFRIEGRDLVASLARTDIGIGRGV